MKNFKSDKKIELIKDWFFSKCDSLPPLWNTYKIKFPAFTYSKNYGNKDSLHLVNLVQEYGICEFIHIHSKQYTQ